MIFTDKRWLTLISFLAFSGVIYIIWFSLFQDFSGQHGICPRMIPNYLLWLSLILIVIVVVPISYFVVSKRLEEKMEKNLSAMAKLVNHKIDNPSSKNGNVLKLLNPNEKLVVEKLIKSKSALQSEIGRMEGMTKLKTHRAVRGLERKGIVRIEPYGKTNRIVLNEDIKDIFS